MEREVKLGAPAWFRMPALDGLAEGVDAVSHPSEQLSTTYHDTRDLRLARWNVSLRHRQGQGWTLKLPAGDDGALLVREELEFPGNGRRAPAEAVDLVRAYVRGAALAPRIRLRTQRTVVDLRDAEGRLLAEVLDDEVSVVRGRRIEPGFRELEIEIRDETPDALLDATVARLRAAGAGPPDPTSKSARAMGPQEPEIEVESLLPGARASDVVRRAIGSAVVRLIRHDVVMRLDVDPEGVHQARVATRRLRSDLRTFAPLVDPEWAGELRGELGWLADVLGGVRDGDVMLMRMRKRAAGLTGAEGVLASLEERRAAAHVELVATLRGERYTALLDRLVEAARAPVLLPAADARADEVLPALVDRPWRVLRRSVKRLSDPPVDEELHDVRIKTKRVRYAAEAVTPVLGKPARTFARAAAKLQDVLGDHNDAIVAETWLREWAAGSRSVRAAFAAGEMAGLERAAAEATRSAWPAAWTTLHAARLE